MAVRFAPFAKIKVASLANFIYKNATDGSESLTAKTMQAAVTDFVAAIKNIKEISSDNVNTVFSDVALATSISISENYNTRATFGIGSPTNPSIIPGTLSVQVTIQRLTTDARQIADYVTKPSFYYSAALQKISAFEFSGKTRSVADLDLLFYTYLFVDSLEAVTYKEASEKLQNAEVIAFMPTTYNKRIESNDAAIITDVSGEGKIFKLRELIAGLQLSTEAAEGLKQGNLPQVG